MCEFHDSKGNGLVDIWWTDKSSYFIIIDEMINAPVDFLSYFGCMRNKTDGVMFVTLKHSCNFCIGINNYSDMPHSSGHSKTSQS